MQVLGQRMLEDLGRRAATETMARLENTVGHSRQGYPTPDGHSDFHLLERCVHCRRLNICAHCFCAQPTTSLVWKSFSSVDSGTVWICGCNVQVCFCCSVDCVLNIGVPILPLRLCFVDASNCGPVAHWLLT